VAFLGFKEILELIDKVAESGISSVEIESAGVTLRIEGARSEQNVVSYIPASAPAAASAPPAAPAPAAAAAAGSAESDLDPSWHIIKSPIVGTFYRSPNPEAEMFVKEGDRVAKGKVLCIIEAMKLMNEIEADADGVVVRVFPQNGQPIEYGEPLFAIKR
jgi:acetyl-CoA carboxylase biotin carboxyl carrier protein